MRNTKQERKTMDRINFLMGCLCVAVVLVCLVTPPSTIRQWTAFLDTWGCDAQTR